MEMRVDRFHPMDKQSNERKSIFLDRQIKSKFTSINSDNFKRECPLERKMVPAIENGKEQFDKREKICTDISQP